MRRKIVKRIYEVYEIDKFGNIDLIEIMDESDKTRKYLSDNPHLRYAKWGITDSGETKIIMCDGYFLSKRIEDIIK